MFFMRFFQAGELSVDRFLLIQTLNFIKNLRKILSYKYVRMLFLSAFLISKIEIFE